MITLQSNKKTTGTFFAVVVFFLLSSTGTFAQEVNVVPNAAASNEVVADADPQSAEMEFVSWFMAEKKSNSVKENFGTTATNASAKKKFINCGMVPNRILSKSFLKKATSRDNSVA